jgi:hypothetical protein
METVESEQLKCHIDSGRDCRVFALAGEQDLAACVFLEIIFPKPRRYAVVVSHERIAVCPGVLLNHRKAHSVTGKPSHLFGT